MTVRPWISDMEDLSMATQPKPRSNGANGPSVAERAYAIWESEGKPHGHDMEHWLRAEAEAAPKPKAKPAARPRKPAAKTASKPAARSA